MNKPTFSAENTITTQERWIFMNQKKNTVIKFIQNKGFYFVLVVCVIAAAVSSYLAIETLVEQFTDQAPLTYDPPEFEEYVPEQPVINSEPDIPIEQPEESDEADLDEQSQQDNSEDIIEEPMEPVEEVIEQTAVETIQPVEVEEVVAPQAVPAEPLNFMMPVNGEIIQTFSGEELIFNETMNDWRTHNGVDIASPLDTPVVASQSGVVTSVSVDDLWGGVVEMESDGVTIRYCGLNSEISAQKGQELRCGDVIGRVGETPSEISLPSHIHIEAIKDGEYFDFTELQS